MVRALDIPNPFPSNCEEGGPEESGSEPECQAEPSRRPESPPGAIRWAVPARILVSMR